jgi:HK97 family phage major capsid protein
MSVSSAVTGQLDQLQARRQELRTLFTGHLEKLVAAGRGQEQVDVKGRSIEAEIRQVEATIRHQQAEVKRAGNPSFGQSPKPGNPTQRPTSTAGQLAPLHFPDEELRRAQVAAQRGEGCRLESRDPGFSTADPLLPPQLYPYPVAAQHESRLLDRLPGYAIESPSVTFIRHVSTSGAPAVTAEGALKPEVIFNTDALTATAVKLAANNGLSWEIISDWPSFQSYAGQELYKQIIDLENLLLIQGNAGLTNVDVDQGLTSGTTELTSPTGMQGFFQTPGILSYNASVDTGGSGSTLLSALDSVEKAIAELRIGPALATPDLLVLHPSTWSALRRIKDGFGHFMVQPDPTSDQASELWGIPVLQTTQKPPGYGVLLDTSKLGYVAVRESLSMRIGYSGTDFAQNILRTVAEERLVLCVTRPPAVLLISNLPTS